MIVCAALKIDQPQPLGFIMICGLRHADCYETLYILNPELSKHARKWDLITEGFCNNNNEFKNREDAYQEALRCGQISVQAKYDKAQRHENLLYSEDLY